jgi:hypothetical protein
MADVNGRVQANDMHDAMLDMRSLVDAFEGLALGPRQDGHTPGWLWSVARTWERVEAAWEACESVSSVSAGPSCSENGYFQKLAVVEPGMGND